jgi:hypothetical protein
MENYQEDRAEVLRQRRHLVASKLRNNVSSKKGREFTLTAEALDWPDNCPVLGIPLNYRVKGQGKRAENSPSFDRLDSNKGYTPDNVRVISWRANRIKNDGTLEEHRKIVQYLESVA